MSHKTLATLSSGMCAKILALRFDDGLRQRFEELGFYEGAKLKLLRKAPFGGPLQIETQATSYALDPSYAQLILIEVI